MPNAVVSCFAAVTVALLATGLAACGDEDEGPSKSEYIEKADALCAATDVKVDAALAPDDPKPEEAQAALRTILPHERKQLADLRGLEKPDGDQDEVDPIYDALERGVDALEAASRDPDASLAFIEGEGDKPFSEVTRLAGDYGMVDCGESRPTLSGQP